jgi:hypothetical protein
VRRLVLLRLHALMLAAGRQQCLLMPAEALPTSLPTNWLLTWRPILAAVPHQRHQRV